MSKVLNPKAWYLLGIGAAALALDGTRRLIKKRRLSAGREVVITVEPETATPAPAAEPAIKTPVTRAKTTTAKPAANDLTEIKGIGPTFARRLTEAGITTFAELAAATPDYLREVTKASAIANPNEWIAQARLK